MSLEKWSIQGYLSRELDYYTKLSKKAKLDLIIYSYGRNDQKFLNANTQITLLQMPNWIPRSIPFKLQNFIFHTISLVIFYKYFKNVVLVKTNQFAAFFFGLCIKFFYTYLINDRKPIIK